MKKILLSTFMMLLAFVAYSAVNDGTPEITFENVEHDFGTFSSANPKVSCEFVFKNTGDAPLVIHRAIASCGCTVPEYSKVPIKPGETGKIVVVYNGAGRREGYFEKHITVWTNAKNTKGTDTVGTLVLLIKGNMTSAESEAK